MLDGRCKHGAICESFDAVSVFISKSTVDIIAIDEFSTVLIGEASKGSHSQFK